MSEAGFAAVDLGASSGRVMAARVGPGTLELDEVRRFPNRPVRVNGTQHWDVLGLYGNVLDGLRAAPPGLASVGIDSWAVDHGLLDGNGALLGNPVHYRDSRTDGVMERVRAEVGDDLLYQASGSQFLPFNTIYQLAADDPEFLPPGDMPARIAAHCRRRGLPAPEGRAATVRCVLDSLALAHRAALRQAAALSGRDVDVVHLVGGGSRNDLLCRLTADASGLPVVAGPVEATALGNVLAQARAHGAAGGLAETRALVAATQPLRRFEPSGGGTRWDEAAARLALPAR